jgi:hypothetical protein
MSPPSIVARHEDGSTSDQDDAIHVITLAIRQCRSRGNTQCLRFPVARKLILPANAVDRFVGIV